MKLINIKEITGTIVLKSGLHIGAGDNEIKIGGTDNPVVKHPHTNEPYIPGSSLKGKIRSLLEMRSGLMGKTGGSPLGFKDLNSIDKDKEKEKFDECSNILKLFGASGAEEDNQKIGPCRGSFGDCPLDDNWKKEATNDYLAYTEVKSENSINRIKGTASNPRFTERVPSGVKFSFCITLRKIDGDEEQLEDLLLEGLKLLEMDALGGNGSRGYGQVQFQFDDKELQKKFEKIQPFQGE